LKNSLVVGANRKQKSGEKGIERNDETGTSVKGKGTQREKVETISGDPKISEFRAMGGK